MRLAIALAVLASPAAALSLDAMSLASSIGSVLASEEACEFSYDHDAIRAFIAEQPPATDLGFASQLSLQTSGMGYQIRDMTPSQLVAHCAVIEAGARSYGFIGQPAPSQ